ncbi:MAG: hypothetical protein ACJZ59_05545 [Candidatus Thalassarchaeaceae archaeon]
MFETMLLNHANPIAALVSSIIVFLVVAYAESSKLELPLTHGKMRGHKGQYPIRLVYASNIPVILMAALLAKRKHVHVAILEPSSAFHCSDTWSRRRLLDCKISRCL